MVSAVPETKTPPPCQKEQRAGVVTFGRKKASKRQNISSGQAHIRSGVVVDIAAFKVCHSTVGIDKDATALRAARARSSSTSIGAMDEMSGKVQNVSTHMLRRQIRVDIGVGQRRRAQNEESPALPAARARSASIGAMDEMSEKVQHANTHILRHQDHEHAHSSRSVQGSVQGGNG